MLVKSTQVQCKCSQSYNASLASHYNHSILSITNKYVILGMMLEKIQLASY